MRQWWFIIWVALVSAGRGAEPLVVKSAAPAPQIDSLFEQADGWIGADGVFSVALSPRKTLWLFNDTWVGKVRDGRRTEATMVNNSVGVQEGAGRHLKYSIGRGPDGKPAALIVPADGRGWFWPQAAAADRGRLALFLDQVEKTDAKSVFGFRCIGLWLGTVADADQAPESWHVDQVKMPNALFSREHVLAWGAAVLRVGDELYVYGIDERRGQGRLNRQMVLARVPAGSIGSFAAWRYFRDGAWSEDFRSVSPLAGDLATEYSVTPFGKRYLAVYTERGLSPRIVGRTAERPWGPWSAPVPLYECPEMSRDKKVFSYAAKAHPALSSDGALAVSYVVNSFDFWQVAREANLYWPRFVRVKLGPR